MAVNCPNVTADIAFGKGRITATGEIRPVSQTDSTTTLDLQGSVRGLDLKELAALWPAYLKDADYDGTANVIVKRSRNREAAGDLS